MTRYACVAAFVVLAAGAIGVAGASAAAPRRVVALDGEWEIAEGGMEAAPQSFGHRVAVPGLADMAKPAFEAVGETAGEKLRQAFWYRRTFTVEGPVPAVARLKIHKAAFGARVFLNGKAVGDHVPSFTPVLVDVREGLRGDGRENELIVRVGASRAALPKGVPDGFDFEKVRYIPGLYDSVELILSGTPHVVRVQAAPDLANAAVRVAAVVANAGPAGKAALTCRVREAATGREVGRAEAEPVELAAGEERTIEVRVALKPCRLWSPEDPFLYELEATTGADTLRTRFGMRDFRFDPKTGRAMLNGRPYYLRGTNVCIFRFFEDPARGDRPWREEWVRRMHRVFRSMHWNAIRYCIGFPPEAWYRVADEEGLLIQDEFPIWYGNQWPAELKSEELVREYTEWMQERWNHPCVVIWDAQNETVTQETGKAIQAVRGLDLSNRPWDNGWSPPQAPGDVYEAHPYLMIHPSFRMGDLARMPAKPGGNVFPNKDGNPVVINEYGWLWLNRDGSPTTLSRGNYERLLGPDATAQGRRELYARLLAAKTEFWRGHRQAAGVLEFCGLGYSRPGGQTSDHFTDIEPLAMEPHFRRYVGDAFAPVGLMIDEWAEDLPAGKPREVRVVVINDLENEWEGAVRLTLAAGEKAAWQAEQACRVAGFGSRTLAFQVEIPGKPGRYQLVAELAGGGGPPVRSLRDVAVLSDEERRARDGIARGKPVEASSTVTVNGESFPPANAVDGAGGTRWSSEFSDPQWIAVDLGRRARISRVELVWEAACGKAYAIEVSDDGKTWVPVHKTDAGKGGLEVIRFAPVEARWARMYGTARATPYGYSLWEFRVFP